MRTITQEAYQGLSRRKEILEGELRIALESIQNAREENGADRALALASEAGRAEMLTRQLKLVEDELSNCRPFNGKPSQASIVRIGSTVKLFVNGVQAMIVKMDVIVIPGERICTPGSPLGSLIMSAPLGHEFLFRGQKMQIKSIA